MVHPWRVALVAAASLALAACASTRSPAEGMPVVDVHQHLVSRAFAPIVRRATVDGRKLVAALDIAGIRHAVVLSTAYSFADERKGLPDPDALTRQENDWVADQVSASGGRLVGFCSANPLRDAALAELERCLGRPGMVGIKLHFGNSGVTLRDPAHAARLARVADLAQRRDAAVLVHMRARGGLDYGAADVGPFMDTMVSRAAGKPVIVAHLGGAGPGYSDQADEVMGAFAEHAQQGDPRMARVYFDLASVVTRDTDTASAQRIAARIRQLGPDRILFGSDLGAPGDPVLGEAWSLVVSRLPLTPEELAVIAGNDAGLFD